jgi:hypothetical protein
MEPTRRSGHKGVDPEGETGGGEEIFRGNVRVERWIGEAVEVAVDGKPRGKGGIGKRAGQPSGKAAGGVGMGIDAGVEIVEEKGVLGSLGHEEVGDAAGGNDGEGGGGIGGGVGEGFGGGGVAGEVFPIEGGDGGNAGEVPEIRGEFGGGEDGGDGDVGSGGDGRVGEGRAELGGEGLELEGAEPARVGGSSAEEGGKLDDVQAEGEDELDNQDGMGEEPGTSLQGMGGECAEKKESGGESGEGVPAGLEKIEEEANQEKGAGKKRAPGPRTPEQERNGRQSGEDGAKEKQGERAAMGRATSAEGEKLINVAGVEAEHEGGAGNVPIDRAEEAEDRQDRGGGEGEKDVREEGGSKSGGRTVAETCETEEGFADTEEGEGVEGVIGLETHGEVGGSVFEKPEEKGGDEAGEAPEAPDFRSEE